MMQKLFTLTCTIYGSFFYDSFSRWNVPEMVLNDMGSKNNIFSHKKGHFGQSRPWPGNRRLARHSPRDEAKNAKACYC